jgi:8-oxo-dGTP pyrophosphatase MutT (NUDIX family)
LTPDGRVLLEKRCGGDYEGHWAFPGGWLEEGETLEQCARRECLEEVGYSGEAPVKVWWRKIGTDVDFTTFIAYVDEFPVTLARDEASAYVWIDRHAALELLLHPGDVLPLKKFDMDELGIAYAMRDGELTSPQRYANMLLVALRITGTGAAYRPQHEEYVWRDPSLYLNEEFLQRCNGLPVLWEHPKKSLLNSDEFEDRIVGTVFVPYIQGEDVWAIAKIYDDETAAAIESEVLSTSPGVNIRTAARMKMGDGEKLLIEGKAAVLDHVAIVALGVWDKGGPPTGLSNDTLVGELAMADEEKKDASALMDALDAFSKRMDAKLDAMNTTMDAKLDAAMHKMDSRLDAFEKKDAEKMDAAKKDAEKMDAAKKDAEKMDAAKEEDCMDAAKLDAARADAASALAATAAHAAVIADLQARVPVELPQATIARLTATQQKAEKVAQAFGDSAERWLSGEDERSYRIRMATKFKPHSAKFKDVDLTKINDDGALTVIEDAIYSDAYNVAVNPTNTGSDLRMAIETDQSGRRIHRFYGGERAAWARFTNPDNVGRINTRFDR